LEIERQARNDTRTCEAIVLRRSIRSERPRARLILRIPKPVTGASPVERKCFGEAGHRSIPAPATGISAVTSPNPLPVGDEHRRRVIREFPMFRRESGTHRVGVSW
jgi:hypothetical protein